MMSLWWQDLAGVLIATVLLLVAILLARRGRVWLLAKFTKSALWAGKIPVSLETDVTSHLLQAAQALISILTAAAIIFFIYLWIVYSLNQFSLTAVWSERLREFLFNLFMDFAGGALRAVPGLFAVVLIILIARWSIRLINAVFKEVQSGHLAFAWLERETARTTQTLIVVAVCIFALVVAYPYIPGSDTEAFKGLSVLVGLMITLGSTGLINQIISGLFVIYSRSVRPGDYVRIGDTEGQVIEVGFLATKLKTPRQEEITLPHSVLVGAGTTNYSRLAGNNGMVLTVSVTIGYDVPWRQVHAMLLLGASRTPGLRTDPPPRVLQRELSDFSVQYSLLAHLEEGGNRAEVLSTLHGQIQDAFNEFGAQIMSPHFEGQPEKKIFVPKPEWYSAPAAPPPSVDESDRASAGEAKPAE